MISHTQNVCGSELFGKFGEVNNHRPDERYTFPPHDAFEDVFVVGVVLNSSGRVVGAIVAGEEAVTTLKTPLKPRYLPELVERKYIFRCLLARNILSFPFVPHSITNLPLSALTVT